MTAGAAVVAAMGVGPVGIMGSRSRLRPSQGLGLGLGLSHCDEEKEKEKEKESATCPVAFMWRWTGAISLPFNHPPVEEVRANFNEKHYPKGVNSKFMEGDCNSCGEQFGNGKGIFEDTECREIAKTLPTIVTMLKQYGLKYGSYVADVGAGTGLVTKVLSKEVGDCGEVYAQEISPGFRELLQKTVEKDKLSNVFVIGGTDKSAKLPEDSFDLVLVCDVYHHFEYPRTMCKSLRKSLRKDKNGSGYLVVIDFHRDDSKIWSKPKGWVMDHVRGSQAEFRAEIESAGFKLVAEPVVDGLTENYVMVFQPI